MRSKTSCFNRTLYFKNLTRYWPLWGLASFGGALFPLALLVNQLHGRDTWQPLEATRMYYSVLCYTVPVMTLIYAVLCAMAVWNYLYQARSVGLMHTLPIRREGLFVTNVFSGLTMMVIPYAVTGVLAIAATSLFGGFEPVGILVTVGGVLGESLFFFGLATLSAMIVGNLLMLPAVYALLNFLAVLTNWMVNMLAGGFCFGLSGSYSGTVDYLSPVVYLMKRVRVSPAYESDTVPDGNGAVSHLVGVELERGWLIAVYAAVGAVLLVLAWLLYRVRRSESAGDVIAVGWMKPVFRYGFAAYAAILGGRLLYAMFWESFQNSEYFALVPLVLCMMVAGAVGYYIASMLLAKSPRVLRKSWKGLAVVALGCVLLCAALKGDLFQVERRVPALDEVTRISLYAADSNYYFTAGQDDALMEQVRALHQSILADKAYIVEKEEHGWNYTYDAGSTSTAAGEQILERSTRVTFTYTLKNGLAVERSYFVPLTSARMAQEGTYDALLDQLINSPEMRAKRIRWQEPGFEIADSWISTRTDGQGLGTRDVNAILNAVMQDAQEGNWGVYDWFRDQDGADDYEISISVGYRVGNDVRNAGSRDYIDIQVRQGMTHTVETLQELGLVTDRDLITDREIYPWQYIVGGWEEYDRFTEQFHMSPEEYFYTHGRYPDGWFGVSGRAADADMPGADGELPTAVTAA